ncbi:MAG: hypothetical protein JWM86_2577, partial [Thermoleophilia bacterium]|nr:hypothetical protein [Thermoleophilia bacterium]
MSAIGLNNAAMPYVAAQALGGSPPVAGAQAGSVEASGGLVDDGLPRTAAIAAGVGASAYGSNVAASDAAAYASQQQAASMPTAGTAAGAGQAGPAAWDESWAKRFKDAGAPTEVIQQLTFTGAMGADAATLQGMLDQVTTEIDTQLAKFSHDHPEAFKKLRSNPAVDRGMVAQIAAGVNAGQIKADQLDQLVDSIGKSQGKMLFDTLVKPMLVYSLIPGWGALRLGFAPFTGGKDPLTGEKMFGDKMTTAMSIAMGVGGGITIFNNVRGAMQVAQGSRLVAAGGDAARIAAADGVANLSGLQKFAKWIPGTNTNKVYSGLARLDTNLTKGIEALKAGSLERELAENVVTKWRAGEISILGDPASKFTKMGFQPNARGMLLGRNKPMASVGTNGAKAAITLDGRMTGKTLAAHLASVGVDFADDTVKNNMLKTRVFGDLSHTDASALKLLRERTLGNAANQMLESGFISRPTGFGKVVAAVRPGPLQDALWAADNVNAGTFGKLHGTAGIPKFAKWGVGGLLAAGAGYMFMVKPQMDAAKKAAEEAAKGEQAPGGAAPGGPAGGDQQLQAALAQFAALPADQQAQIIQEQYAAIQQAGSQPNLTTEQQAAIQTASAELQQFMQVASQGAGQGAGAGTAMGGGAPATGAQ